MIDRDNNLPELPEGWVFTRLGDVLEFEYGKGLRKDKRNANGSVPVYGSNGIVGYHSIPLTNKASLIVGRKGAIGEVHLSEVPSWPIDTTYYIYPPNGIDIYYLYYLANTLNLPSLDKSTAIPGLNRDDAYALIIPLPPLPEQNRIVAKIEELFTKLDAGVEALKKVKAQLKSYRQAVLKHAFEGKLTKEWRDAHKGEIEPASVLMERIKEGLKRNVRGKVKELPPLDTSDLPKLPDGWVRITLQDACLKVTDGSHYTPKYVTDGYPFITISDIQGDKIAFSSAKLIHKIDYEKLKNNCNPLCGDVLFSKDGTVGKVIEIDFEKPFVVLSSLAIIRPHSNIILSRYLRYILQSNLVLSQATNLQTGTALTRIILRNLKTVVIPIPPIPEQLRIVEEIERCFSVADKIERIVAQNLKPAERLRQSILKRAFEGKLVKQNPTDEPAGKLLERIKAEKAKRETEKKAVGRGRKRLNTIQGRLM